MTDSPSAGSSKLVLLGGAAGVLIAVAIGVGAALSGGEDDPGGGLATSASAPKAPDAPPTPSGEAPLTDEAPADAAPTSGPKAFALRMAGRLEAASEEGAALEILDEYLREHGSDDEITRARNALFVRCDSLVVSEVDRLRKLASLGQDELVAEKIEALRLRLPTALHGELDMVVAGGTEVASADAKPASAGETRGGEATVDPEADNPQLKTFELLLRNLGEKADAEAQFKLGEWALKNGLKMRARSRFKAALAQDGFHEGARQALGHEFHEGRWYEPDAYKRDVLGLAQNAKGEWVKPDALATRPKAKEQPKKPKAVAKALVPPPPPSPYQEDKEWYKDNEKLCEFEDAPEYKSEYYRIKTNVKKEYAKRYGKMMDRYFKRFVRVFKAFLPDKKYEKSEIWIFASHDEFLAATKMPKTVGGFYNTKNKRVTAYHGFFGKQGTTRDVLAHEGTHQFEDLVLQGKFNNAPIWIIEGLAVYFESAFFIGGDIKVGLVPRERLYALKRGLAAGKLIPLKDLIRTPKQRFTGYHYAHAWSLIYMVLYYSKSAKVRKRCVKWFSDLFTMAYDKRVSPADVEKGVGGREAFLELEAQWKEWIGELKYEFDPKKHRF